MQQEQAALKSEVRRALGNNVGADDADTDSESFFSVRRKTQVEEAERQEQINAAFARGLSKAETAAAAKER